MRRLWRASRLSLLLGLSLLWPAGAQAQDQGVAVITSPLEGAILTGLVPITGSATHPQFVRYELTFGYSPNSTDTWFSIQPPAQNQVVNEIIGRWDTTRISDGTYTLRLRVYYADSAFLEAFVPNVRVQNATPTPPPPTRAVDTPAPQSTGVPVPTATPPVIDLPPTATARPTASVIEPGGGEPPPVGVSTRINAELIGMAFVSGVRLTLICFLLLAAYASLRAVLRARPRP